MKKIFTLLLTLTLTLCACISPMRPTKQFQRIESNETVTFTTIYRLDVNRDQTVGSIIIEEIYEDFSTPDVIHTLERNFHQKSELHTSIPGVTVDSQKQSNRFSSFITLNLQKISMHDLPQVLPDYHLFLDETGKITYTSSKNHLQNIGLAEKQS